MRRIAKRAEIRVVRGFDPDPAAGLHQTVKLFHRLDHIVDVFNHMDRAQVIEGSIGERIREAIEIADDIRFGGKIPVNP